MHPTAYLTNYQLMGRIMEEIENFHILAQVEEVYSWTREPDDRSLNEAVRHNAPNEMIKKLLHMDLEKKNHLGYTPIHLCHTIEVYQLLIEAGADPHATDKHGTTVLMNAVCMSRPIEYVQWLLDHGYDPTTERDDKRTASCYARTIEMYLLLTNGQELTNEQKLLELKTALENKRDYGYIKFLLDQGIDLSESDALHDVFDIETYHLVKNYGAPTRPTKSGATLLHHALLCSSCLDYPKYLIDQGHPIDMPNNGGVTPLHYTYRCTHYEFMKQYANMNICATHRDNMLLLAVNSNRDPYFIQHLLNDYRINTVDEYGTPVIHFVCQPSVYDILVDHGAENQVSNIKTIVVDRIIE